MSDRQRGDLDLGSPPCLLHPDACQNDRFHRGWAGVAGGGEELGVGGEVAWVDDGLPARDRRGAAFMREVWHGDADGQCPECDESIDDLDAFHRSHRMPKYHTDQMCSARSMYRR